MRDGTESLAQEDMLLTCCLGHHKNQATYHYAGDGATTESHDLSGHKAVPRGQTLLKLDCAARQKKTSCRLHQRRVRRGQDNKNVLPLSSFGCHTKYQEVRALQYIADSPTSLHTKLIKQKY